MKNNFIPDEELARTIRSRGLRYFIVTYGCQMNVHDSEKIAGMLEQTGYVPADDPESADLILYNTCCVREHAESRVFGNVGHLKQRKEAEPGLVIGVCGCMMQQEQTAKRFARTFPFVDIIFGTHDMHLLPLMIRRALLEGERSMYLKGADSLDELPVRRALPPLSYVSIMQGCNNFCTYCIVPYVRGRERSREPQGIIDEVKGLSGSGYKEVMLLGQNVNSYGKGTGTDFPLLLSRIARETGMERIRFMTSHPKDASPALFEVMAANPVICPNLHLPVQSGSTRVLKAMNRGYTREYYLELVERVRGTVPGVALSTDIIVGFPGETEKDFSDTLDLVKKVRCDSAYTFVYSPRKGTRAAEMPGQIPEEEKQRRITALIDVQSQITYESNLAYVGRKETVLVEGLSRRDACESCGRTGTGKMVNFEGVFEPGTFVDVLIREAKRTTLSGEVL